MARILFGLIQLLFVVGLVFVAIDWFWFKKGRRDWGA